MSDRGEDRPDLSAESERFVRELSQNYGPDPQTPAGERAFDAELYERLETPTPQPLWKPALITALVAAAIGWLLMPPPPEEGVREDSVIAQAAAPEDTATEALAALVEDEGSAHELDWAIDFFTATDAVDLVEEPYDDFLPEDYDAIGGMLLGG